ncbi:magnesium transporter CorA family protein [Bacillus luteolus]|uniref:Magnesium transporter CorA family protein n=1 Tax=Litchfieldia luteola TaxID=682179 RepID=A0ABR9QJC9_9BACI|nr:magnesium transporter CorA family protein [Cytobacillus luteolus]MBE4908590.1 magnesium transporter CorA family protein [Cytobacillus luteolus]MBP1941445.1 magnesium transporter [Cytobacillus luteolus]
MLCYKKKENKITDLKSFHAPGKDEQIWFHSRDENELKACYEKANIHPLARRAMKSKDGEPRVDVYKDHAFICVKIIQDDFSFVSLNIVVADSFIISTVMKDIKDIEEIQKQFKTHPEQMVSTGHILYHIMDAISSDYLEMVDIIADEIQQIEEKVFIKPFSNEIGHEIHNKKFKLHEMRQIIEAQENVIKDIGHTEFPYVNEESGFYMNDLIQSFSRVTGAFDSFKENLTSIFDLQMSLKSDHMNIIMKTLTLVSVIFIPMTFIAGLYGMNFEKMPELKWEFGYLYGVLLMFGIGGATATYFKKKGWW